VFPRYRRKRNEQLRRSLFRVGKGTTVVKAIIDCIYQKFVKWPDLEEQRIITERIRKDFGLPNCIGVADGTLLPLAFQPSMEDYADYQSRKILYTLTMLVVNDDQWHIRYFNAVGPDQPMMTGSCKTQGLFWSWSITSKPTTTLLGTVPTVPKILWFMFIRSQWVPLCTWTTRASTQGSQNPE
jgi:hypothetical protein